MSVSVENIMVEKAQASLSSFLDFVSQLVRDLTAGAFPAAAEADTARASVAPVGHRLRRWPTAIAISSVQELDLEVPLLQVRWCCKDGVPEASKSVLGAPS
eukprot:29717-Chlamydomonas_euryale.AAC.6